CGAGGDGAEGPRRARAGAGGREQRLQAEVLGGAAVRRAADFVMSFPPLPAEAIHDLRRHFEEYWCRPLRDAGVPYRSYAVEESAAHALVRLAEREHADLIVLGAHGHGGFADRLLGSTSYSVSHAAPCPVVIIPAESRAA